jgi:hypothetical protein
MSLIAQFLPIIVAVSIAVIFFWIYVLSKGLPSPSKIAFYILLNVVISYVAFEAARDSGLLGLFAGEYNDDSIASFAALCEIKCVGPEGRPDICERYCRCVVNRARISLTYEDMIARITAMSNDEIDTAWRRADRVCRTENNFS